jgi:fructan beta-fructosidase
VKRRGTGRRYKILPYGAAAETKTQLCGVFGGFMFRFAGAILLASFAACYCAAQNSNAPGSSETANFRPQVHFSPHRNWTNDPNGLVYFDGEYHLFYQYNPFGDQWGHMSWGHAVSKDLLHWTELPVAIPEADGEMVFTGSVVVDEKNTSGLCKDGRACMVAVYTGDSEPATGHREVQNLAVSQDRGRTWTRYAGNPVLDLHMTDFRDPNVSWNEESHSWVMAVALPKEHQVAFYGSPDLKQWTRLGTFGPDGATSGVWECPDLLRIPAKDGRSSMWALKVGLNPGSLQGGSGEQYFLGSFDGKTFTRSGEPGSQGWTDYGKDSYCAISYNHLPAGVPPTLLGWMSNWDYAKDLPTSPWRGQMTLARHVTLVHDEDGLALSQDPVIAAVRDGAGVALAKTVPGTVESVDLFKSESPAELMLRFDPADAQSFGVRVYSDAEHWTEIGFDRARMRFYVDRTRSGLAIAKGFLTRTEAPLAAHRGFDVHVVIDRSSVEAFAQGGTIAMTNLIFPPAEHLEVKLLRRGGHQALRVTGRSWKLHSAL